MKKIIKYTIFLVLIISIMIIFSGEVFAKTCSEYNYNDCPKDDKCLWDPNGKCYDKSTSCEAINDTYSLADSTKRKKLCDSRSDCNWVQSTNNIEKLTISPNAGKCESKNAKNSSSTGTSSTSKSQSDLSNNLIIKKTTFKCSDVKHLTAIWLFLRIASPFIVVLFASLDFFKAVIANDEKKMKESRGRFVKRLIAFFLLLILPFVVQFVFERVGTYGSQNTCLVKCIVTNNTSSKGCD